MPVDEAELRGWQREAMLARVALVHECERLARGGGISAAYRAVAAAAAEGRLSPQVMALVETANRRKGQGRTVSAASLRRWHAEYRAFGRDPKALVPAGAANANGDAPAWMADFLDFYAIPSKPSVAAAREEAIKRRGTKLPALRTVQNAVKAMPAIERARGRMGPRALRQLKAFVRRDVADLWPSAVYVMDGHTLDARVAHPITGKPFRPEVTSIIDVVTRRLVGWSVALSENTFGTIDALRHAYTTSAICDIYYVDRGRGLNNTTLDHDVTGILARFDVQKERSLPYRSQARGVIERLHQVWIKAARWLPTYAGVDMDPEARKSIDKRMDAEIAATGTTDKLMAWPDFIDWCTGVVADYNARPHTSLGKKSPDQVWAEWIARGWRPDVATDTEVEVLFRPQERRQCRRGEVSLFNNRYFSQVLEDWHERDVLIAYDIHDASRVWVMTLDQRLICEAAWNGNAVSYFPKSVVEAAHEKRVDGRVRRAQAHVDAAEAERAPLQLEIVAEQPMPLVASPPVAREFQVVSTPDPARPIDARPAWRNDADMAAWLLANPARMTAQDAAHIRERLRSGTFRLRLECDGIDIPALEALVKKNGEEHA